MVLPNELKLRMKLEKCNKAVERTMVTKGIPGLSVGITLNGQKFWSRGFGFSNVEEHAVCNEGTVMRIASISKPITATIAARLYQQGLLDLDKDIRDYIPEFPKKQFEGKPVTITLRQLLSHTSGIRHYKKSGKDESSSSEDGEFLSNKQYKDVSHALEIFKNDELVVAPGTKFSYTTHGLTLVAAVLEKASGMKFPQLAGNLFHALGMQNTTLDTNERIIPGRSRFYKRNSKHILINCPEVNCSYKFAGGGILSNVNDLLTFANAVLYSCQNQNVPALVDFKVMSEFLNPQVPLDSKTNVGLGWFMVPSKQLTGIDGRISGGYFYHTGAAMGASSALLISPDPQEDPTRPSGICIAILCNLLDAPVLDLAVELEHIIREP